MRKKIKLKEIYGYFLMNNYDPTRSNYDIEGLKEDIRINGLTNDDNPITVFNIDTALSRVKCRPFAEPWSNIKYKLWDGNHRCFVLKELYGDDYKVSVKVDDSPFTRINIQKGQCAVLNYFPTCILPCSNNTNIGYITAKDPNHPMP